MSRSGFTMVEVIIALVILGVGILGLASTAARLTSASSRARQEASAIRAVDDRMSMILMHPDYEALDSLFSGTEDGVPGLSSGSTRTTEVDRIRTEAGDSVDYTRVVVTVNEPRLPEPVSRVSVVAAP